MFFSHRTDKRGEMTRSMKSKLEKSMNNKGRIPFKLESDKKSEMIIYCSNYHHQGILFNGKAKKCLEMGCNYIVIFRPEDY